MPIAKSRIGNKTWGWWSCLLIGLGALMFRALNLQVSQGDYFYAMANEQRIRLVSIPASRGIIYDRNGVVLVRNVPVFRKLEVDRLKGLTLPIISRDEALEMSRRGNGSQVIEAVDRDYLFGDQMSSVLGYLGEATEDEIDQGQSDSNGCVKDLKLGSLLGRSGIENWEDCRLRGKDGTLMVEVDTSGGMVRELGRQAPVSGDRVDLTIDSRIQQIATQAMDGKTGAVVVLDPFTGEIHGLVSTPTYDPAVFGMRSRIDDKQNTSNQLVALFNNSQKPLLNRTVSAVYPPGSLFKLATSLAGLQEKSITADEQYVDTGIVQLGSYQFRNWYFLKYGAGEGAMNVVKALSRSTDTFFYDLGGKLGPDKMAYWARQVGLGRVTGVEIPGEVNGLIPDSQWKLKTKQERWYLGDSYHMAIGQGDVLVTPLQAAMMSGVFTTGGVICQPHLQKNTQESCEKLTVDQANMETVLMGMVAVCSPGGTAGKFNDEIPRAACKTGTAEYGPVDATGRRNTHAWITVVGPVAMDKDIVSIDASQHPVVITVLVESGGEGSVVAAPIAKVIYDAWFEK